jgi:hypothetical protein
MVYSEPEMRGGAEVRSTVWLEDLLRFEAQRNQLASSKKRTAAQATEVALVASPDPKLKTKKTGAPSTMPTHRNASF